MTKKANSSLIFEPIWVYCSALNFIKVDFHKIYCSQPVTVATDPFLNLFSLSCLPIKELIGRLISTFCCYFQGPDSIVQDHALIITLNRVYCFPFLPSRKVHCLLILTPSFSMFRMQIILLFLPVWRESERKFFTFFYPGKKVICIFSIIFTLFPIHQPFFHIQFTFYLFADLITLSNLLFTFLRSSFLLIWHHFAIS